MEFRRRLFEKVVEEDTVLPLHSIHEPAPSFYLKWMRSIKKLIRGWCKEREIQATTDTHVTNVIDAHLLHV
jgi:hypothetical protein